MPTDSIPPRIVLTCLTRREGLQCRLFGNDFAPAPAGEPITAFQELVASGYSAIPLNQFDWLISDDDAKYPGVVFKFTGAVRSTVYGYYVADPWFPETALIAGRLPKPAEIGEAGGEIEVNLRLWS